MQERLTYANVISTLALFLVLAGGVAYAAKVAKRSVGAPQLKANAVTTAKIKANAITTRKIKRNAVSSVKIKNGAIGTEKIANGAIETEKIANGSVTNNDLEPVGMPFGRVVHRSRGSIARALSGTAIAYPLSEAVFSQAGNEVDSFVGAVDVTVPAACAPPREVEAAVLLDAPNPATPSDPSEIVAAGVYVDNSFSGGAVNHRIELGPAPASGPGEAFLGVGQGFSPTRFEPGASRAHVLSLALAAGCTTGSGVTATFGGVDVIGTK